MPPYKYFAMKFVNQWATKESLLHTALSKKVVDSETIAKALHYFQVARTFENLEKTKNREFIAEQLIEHSKYLTANNFAERVEDLACIFEKKFGSKNISAASKLLWLRKRSPVLIFDKWARVALEKLDGSKIESYLHYAEVWQKHFQSCRLEIESCAHNMAHAQEYSALWNIDLHEFQEITHNTWFAERVFDMYLLQCGRDS
jgi:hypothetical protein